MGESDRAAQEHLREALMAAEGSAAAATRALLGELSSPDAQVRDAITVVRSYCATCPDPFQALDVARLLRALVDALRLDGDVTGPIAEWAYAEVRLQSLVSRTARVLRDQRALAVEQVLIDLSVRHLRAVEESPRYATLLAEMTRVSASPLSTQPVSSVQQFFGLARRDFALPTIPDDDR